MHSDVRTVARVRINRWTGVRAVKVGAPKTEWQLAAEKEFLAMRTNFPKDALLHYLAEDDIRNLSPEMRKCLTLRNASAQEQSKWRTHQQIRKFQNKPFDTNSLPVRIATLTEKIMRMRAHLLRNPRRWGHQMVKISMAVKIGKRKRAMQALYRNDFTLYKHVCQELGLRVVRFAVPGSKDPSKKIAPTAVDGDQAKWLIRQRLYWSKHRPREMRDPKTNQLIRYTRHPMEPVPQSHGKAQPTPQQISRSWPYAVRADRVAGKQVIYNPTAAGPGFRPGHVKVIGGPIEE